MEFSFTKVLGWFEDIVDVLMARRKHVLAVIIGIFLLGGLFVGYRYYNAWAQEQAHRDFVDALRYYDAPVTSSKTVISSDAIEFATDAEKWARVEQEFGAGYQKHRGARMGSMFGVYQADALDRLGRVDDAAALFAKVVPAIPSVEMQDFYRLKLALVKCDSPQALIQKEGLSDLKAIAEDQKSYAHELGLYYIGAYFWSQRDYVQAKNYWQQYMVKYGFKDAKTQSGFAELVVSRLNLISVDW